MTTLLESFQALLHSENRYKFVFSMVALFLWFAAIGLAFLSGSQKILHGDYLITALLAISALLAINSVPRRQSRKAEDKEFTKGSDINHAANN